MRPLQKQKGTLGSCNSDAKIQEASISSLSRSNWTDGILLKLRCTGNISHACERCSGSRIDCIRTQPDGAAIRQQSSRTLEELNSTPSPGSGPLSRSGGHASLVVQGIDCSGPLRPSMSSQSHPTADSSVASSTRPIESLPLGQFPGTTELKRLLKLYFSSIHLFGYFAFVNEARFNHLVEGGIAPKELTMIMIAHVLRFVEKPSQEILSRADAYADLAIAGTLPRTYQSFGAVELMVLLLAQHYDTHRGKFTSAWLLTGNCARMMQMMSLHTFDRTYKSKLSTDLSPLLSREALRRIAWATFYADSIVDGGRCGFHVVDETTLGPLQLPCDESSFATDQEIVTESLFPPHGETESISHVHLGISAYLLRIAAARRRALHFAFRATHREDTVEKLTAELATIESHAEAVGNSLPDHLHLNNHNRLAHQHRLTTFILLHVLRHNLFIIVDRAALQIYRREPIQTDLIDQVRRRRIAHAFPIAELIAEGLEGGIIFDPHMGVQAYVALEILVLEPNRLAATDPYMDPKTLKIESAIGHLLTLMRSLATRSEIVYRLHIEAVYRLLQQHWKHLLNDDDLNSFRRDYRLVGQEGAEYDFRDFRWAKLERVSRDAITSATMPGDEVLLESQTGVVAGCHLEIPTPRFDAREIPGSGAPPPMLHSHDSNDLDTLYGQRTSISNEFRVESEFQPLLEQVISENVAQEFSLDWSTWLFDGSGTPWPTGNSAMF
ncbi:putative Transcription factor domain-containing protein [Seiridium cardinale]